MPFRIRYTREALADYGRLTLTPLNVLQTRKLIGSFPHDRWLRGSPSLAHVRPGADVRELVNGPITVVYELEHTNEVVIILRILVADD